MCLGPKGRTPDNKSQPQKQGKQNQTPTDWEKKNSKNHEGKHAWLTPRTKDPVANGPIAAD